MKNLSKMPKNLGAWFALVCSVLSVLLFWILTTKIENVIKTNLTVSSKGVNKVTIPASKTIELKVKQHIRMHIGNKYYDGVIDNIENMNNGNVELTLKKGIKQLVPNSTVEARIIYSSIPVWQKIIER